MPREVESLVGYDGSPHSGVAVDWAAAEAGRRGTGLTVLYAADNFDVLAGPVLSSKSSLTKWAGAVAEKVVREGAMRAVKTHPAVMRGLWHASAGRRAYLWTPPSQPRRRRRRSRSRRSCRSTAGFRCLLRGSSRLMPDRCSQRRRDDRGWAGPPSRRRDRRFPRLVSGIDIRRGGGSPFGGPAYGRDRVARRSTRRLGGCLLVDDRPRDAARRSCTRGGRADCARRGRRRHDSQPGVAVDSRLVEGRPAKVLAAASRGAGLLVVGARGRGGFNGLRLGSVSHGAIHGATCPVVVVHG